VCEFVNEALKPRTISKSAIIIFLDRMVADGFLVCAEETCKGGHRRVYRMKFDEAGFKESIARMVVISLLRYFPEETRRALKTLPNSENSFIETFKNR
jgi:hypothetical protein